MTPEELSTVVDTISKSTANNQIILSFGDGNWIMKLTPEGVRFNHEAFPNQTNDEAENEIIKILEKRLGVTFNRQAL